MKLLIDSDLKQDSLKEALLDQLYSNDLYRDIIKSTIFKRLEDISFLGAIDYLYEDKHTRYEHTLSVATLALRYAQIKKLSYDDEKYLVSAALLHDIGHAPLSHSMEPLFKKVFGLTHHIAGNNIILGKSPLGKDINTILIRNNIDVDKLINLLDGNSQEEYAFALDNPINIDTIDGIVRTYSYDRKNTKEFFLPDIYSILEATVEMKNSNIVDTFWHLKDYVYKNIINDKVHMYADNFSQKFVEREWTLKEEDFYLTESRFQELYEKLFENLKSIKTVKKSEGKLRYTKRSYIVNSKVIVDSLSKYSEKYTHKKTPSEYALDHKKSYNIQTKLAI